MVVISSCSDNGFLVLGCDFNCTVDATVGRNHLEPHGASKKCLLIELINYKSNDLCNVWRFFHPAQRQYTWAHARDNSISLARLDIFYCLNISVMFLKVVQYILLVFQIISLFNALSLLRMRNVKVHVGTVMWLCLLTVFF